ncbi:helix-turn-helix domain-containing protein [Adlercreutzia caecimuris]|uniref:Helix-turn-helix transcriptional regulator n=1 Tax=Adlercreutzia caecimuris TaxID=671266 RepID=A0A4S4FVC5_9ACTN|nr:helix-turn-helix transcriptional regulator [Adlercreutzia caecimuris]THG34849.1 helix-turn-helix transcriptional regulator [Adlercreutzia caecimuris]
MLEQEGQGRSLGMAFASTAFLLAALQLFTSSEFMDPKLYFSSPANLVVLALGVPVLITSLRELLSSLCPIEQRALYAIVLAGGALATIAELLVQRIVFFDSISNSAVTLVLVLASGATCFVIARRSKPPREINSSAPRKKSKRSGVVWLNWGNALRRGLSASRMLAKPLLGEALLSGIAAFHWGVADARRSQVDGFAEPIELLAPALIVAAVLCLAGALFMLLGRKRIHSKTVFSFIFFGAGALFFIPLLVGSYGMSVPSMMLGVSIVYTCVLVPFSVEKSRDYQLSINAIALLIVLTGYFGAILGSILGFNLGDKIVQDDMLLVGTIVISVYLVMFAPNFFFRFYQAPSLSGTDRQDAYVKSCRIASSRYGLSARESEVLELAGRGYSVNAISNNLFISENTVKAHLKTIYKKVDVHSKQQLIEVIKTIGTEDKIDDPYDS